MMIISVSKEASSIIKDCLDLYWTEWEQSATTINGHRYDYDCDYITQSAILVLPQTQKFARRKHIRIREKIVYTTKLSGFKSLRI